MTQSESVILAIIMDENLTIWLHGLDNERMRSRLQRLSKLSRLWLVKCADPGLLPTNQNLAFINLLAGRVHD